MSWRREDNKGLKGVIESIAPIVAIVAIVAIATIGLISCSGDQPEPQGSQSQAIAMSTYVAEAPHATRANAALLAEKGIPDGKSFGVYAVYHSNSTWAEEYDKYLALDPIDKVALNTLFLPNFMKNQEVTNDAINDACYYSPLKYWPNTPTDHISFMAYYPYSDGSTEDVNTLGIASDWIYGMPYYHATIKENPAEQVDFLVSGLMADCTKQSIQDRVHFLFHHAFSKITFRFVVQPEIRENVAELSVSSIDITNIYNDGNMFPTYNPSTQETTLAWTGHSTSHKQDYSFQPNSFQLLLPQTLREDANLTVSYALKLKSYDTAFTYDASGNAVETPTYTYRNTTTLKLNTLKISGSGTALTEWLPNRHYIYTLRIGAHEIGFEAEVVNWGDFKEINDIELEEQ